MVSKCNMVSAKILVGVQQKYWGVFNKSTESWSEKILRGFVRKYYKEFCKIAEGSLTLWHKTNNFLVKTQGLLLFPVTSWPSIFGDQNLIIYYWEWIYLQIFGTHFPPSLPLCHLSSPFLITPSVNGDVIFE